MIENIYEFEKFLPDWLVKSGQDQFYRFPFEYNHYVFDDSKPFFGKMLYNKSRAVDLQSPYIIYSIIDCLKYELVKKMNSKFEFNGLERVIVNGQTPNQTPEIHCDYDMAPNMWTLVYYVNDADGGTNFYSTLDGKEKIHRSEFKKGKCVIFPSNMYHQAEQTAKDWRISVGICFYVNINDNI